MKSARLIERLAPAVSIGWAERMRRFSGRRLEAVRSLDGEAHALAAALLLGRRAALGPELARRMRDAGLLHLVAISGLHVGLVIWMIHALLRRVPLGRWPGLVLVLALLAGYAVVVGPRAPVLRAAGGAAVLLFGRCLGRRGEAINGLALVAAGLMLLRPGWPSAAGFQLTFAATAGILLFADPWTRRLSLPPPLGAAVAVSGSAYLATAPLAAWHFGWLAPVGLLSNVPAVALCATILGAGYGAILLPAPLASACGGLLEFAVSGLLQVADAAAAFDGGAFPTPRPAGAVLSAYYATWLATAALGQRSPCVARRLARALLLFLLLWIHLGPPPARPAGRAQLALIDVGQGLAVALRDPRGATMLVDAGGSADRRYDPGERTVLPHLATWSGRHLHALVLTHDHLDHVGGAFALLRELDVDELWLPPGSRRSSRMAALSDLARRRGTALVLAERGFESTLGDLPVRVLAPARSDRPGGANDRSIVLRVGAKPARVLIPGDLEASGERELLSSGEPLRSELLVVAHHGSRRGTAAAFLERVHPDVALVSCGRGNPFGHPHPELVDRVRRAGVRLLRTDRLGTFTLEATPRGWRAAATRSRSERR